MAARRRRTAAVFVACAIAITTTLIGSAAPADAGTEITTSYHHDPLLTWVDDDGSQYVVTSVLTSISGSGSWDLVIGRIRPDGTPDPSWGPYTGGYDSRPLDGVRLLDLEAPGDELAPGGFAVDDDGLLTVAWFPTNCPVWTSCEHRYARHDLTGALVGDPVVVPANAGRPSAALPDGSFLTSGPGSASGWWGPDGSERGWPDLGTEQATSTTVDHAGRLLIATSGGRVVRWLAGGPAEVVVADAGCAEGSALTAARATADASFATICSATGTDPLAVQRRAADGTVEWTATPPSPEPGGRMTEVDEGLVDSDGRVWVAGRGPLNSPFAGMGQMAALQAFTSDGASAMLDLRLITNGPGQYEQASPNGFVDLRDGPGDQIGYAEEIACCTFSAGFAPRSSVRAGLVAPAAVLPPNCAVTAVTLSDVDRASAHVATPGCDGFAATSARQPTSYQVEVRSGTLPPAVSHHPVVDGFPPIELDVALQPGVLSEVAVTPENPGGLGPANTAARAVTVAPFPTVDAFVERQILDLQPPGSAPPHEAIVGSVANGGTEPVALIDGWLDTGSFPAAAHVRPIARLYEAFFLRSADRSGLDYWIGRRRAGQRLAQTADRFATSSEFQRRYGTLTDRQFVAKLYENVFGRTADPSGLTYWLDKLQRRTLTRGGVVAQFSESSEYRRRSARTVEPLAAAYLMLDRVPTATERTTWRAAADPQRAAVAGILASAAYQASISATMGG